MEVSGPCLLTVHNGKPCRLYEVLLRKKSIKGTTCTRYFFATWEEAEIYTYYLYQECGVDFINRLLAAKKIPNWEKKEYREFLDNLDLKLLEVLIQGIEFEKEQTFVPSRTKRVKNGKTDEIDDDCEEYGCGM